MKVLAVSDDVVERLYTLAAQGHFDDIDFVLGCGDLPYPYLEYLLTIMSVPLFYVPGNHDPRFSEYDTKARVEGGNNLDLKIIKHNDLLIGGFGGCHQYRPDGVNQYSQMEAYRRAYKMLPRLLWNRRRYGRALDLMIAHSPPFGVHDEETIAHQGLKAINWLVQIAAPRYLLHGHTHFYRRNLAPSDSMLGTTRVINVYPYKTIEIIPAE